MSTIPCNTVKKLWANAFKSVTLSFNYFYLGAKYYTGRVHIHVCYELTPATFDLELVVELAVEIISWVQQLFVKARVLQ